jgi:hypothetical protein
LGREEAALVRLELTPETTLPILDPGTPNANHLFDLLEAQQDSRAAVTTQLAAIGRFAPEGPRMRLLIEPRLRRGGSTSGTYLSNEERRATFMVAEIFAEHFARSDLRQVAIDQLSADPSSECAVAALAETALREQNSGLKSLLLEKTMGRRYELVTAIRVTAAVGNIVAPLEWLMRKDPDEINGFHCAYWVPAVLRRIERDDDVMADALISAADNAPSASARLSELSLLGRGCTNKPKTRPVLERALRAYEDAEVPVVAFDVTTGSYRLAPHVVCELLG